MKTEDMRWTSEPPTEPGWYWHKSNSFRISVAEVFRPGTDVDLWVTHLYAEDWLAALIEMDAGNQWCRIPEPERRRK